ncbi:hypothetical protein L195_g039885, partial [Trifolium pratense]
DARLVYKHLATLYFVFIFDGSENELAMLDLIQASNTFIVLGVKGLDLVSLPRDMACVVFIKLGHTSPYKSVL